MRVSGKKRSGPASSGGSGELVRRYLGWALFGAFGIGVAVGIALVAGQLASQPVGITGQPVSANSSLASPPDRVGSGRDDRRKDRKADGRETRTGAGQPEVVVPSGATGSQEAPGSSASPGPSGSSSGLGGSGSSGSGGDRSGGGSDSPVPDSGDDSGPEYDDIDYDDDSEDDD